jgi:hypothetical protein
MGKKYLRKVDSLDILDRGWFFDGRDRVSATSTTRNDG